MLFCFFINKIEENIDETEEYNHEDNYQESDNINDISQQQYQIIFYPIISINNITDEFQRIDI